MYYGYIQCTCNILNRHIIIILCTTITGIIIDIIFCYVIQYTSYYLMIN